LFRYEIQNGGNGRTWFNIGPYGENISKRFYSETTWTVETKLPMNDHWKVLYKIQVFYADRKYKMATTAGHRLTLDPMGKYSNAFFSETTNQTESKLDRNVHWMVVYKIYDFCSDIKWKMAATAGLNLTLDPMGKVSQNTSSLKPLGQLKPNCPGIIIGRSSKKFFFYADPKSKMAATTGHSINTGPYGKIQKYFLL
jgi:hypothetical protein